MIVHWCYYKDIPLFGGWGGGETIFWPTLSSPLHLCHQSVMVTPNCSTCEISGPHRQVSALKEELPFAQRTSDPSATSSLSSLQSSLLSWAHHCTPGNSFQKPSALPVVTLQDVLSSGNLYPCSLLFLNLWWPFCVAFAGSRSAISYGKLPNGVW